MIKYILLALLSFNVMAGTATISFTEPTEYTNGNPMPEVTGYNLYINNALDARGPYPSSPIVIELEAGEYSVELTTVALNGSESTRTVATPFTIPLVPTEPTEVVVTVTVTIVIE